MKILLNITSYYRLTIILQILCTYVKGGYALPTSYKRRLIFNGEKVDWDDAVNFCLEKGGYLVNIHSKAVTKAIKYYSNNVWNGDWGNDVWTGLYIDELTGSQLNMRMQGICERYDFINSYNAWDSSTPSVSNADSEKKCTMLKPGSFTWTLEKCSQGYSILCEVYIGACTFEVESGSYCAKNYDISMMITTNTIELCHAYCVSLTTNSDEECWAVSYDTFSGNCYPSVNSNPYKYEGRSTNCGQMISPVLSRKRCFEASSDSGSVSNINNPHQFEPLPVCTFTRPTTPQTIPTTTVYDVTTTVDTTRATTTKFITMGGETTTNSIMTYGLRTTTNDIMTAGPRKATDVTTTEGLSATQSTTTEYVITERATTADITTEKFKVTSGDGITIEELRTTTNDATIEAPIATTENITAKVGATTTDVYGVTMVDTFVTTSSTENSSSGCTCLCNYVINSTIDEYTQNIIYELTIDKTNTSSARRKLISVRDMRTSNNAIGSVFCFALLCCMSFILLFDLSNVFICCKKKM